MHGYVAPRMTHDHRRCPARTWAGQVPERDGIMRSEKPLCGLLL